MRWMLLAAVTAAIISCSAPQAPVVDMEGVDPAQHNRDLAECYRTMPAIAAGNPITTCMKEKGYRILVGY